jgi:ADP-ribosyl-[dinitrogen reductase] hydrolase
LVALMNRELRIKGGILGLLIGDALGVPYEFHEQQSIPIVEEIEFQPPEYFRRSHKSVPPGTWSDDGSQALILLNTLLECGKFDTNHFAGGLVDWYDKGFMAVTGKVFDVGIQTSKAILDLKKGVDPTLVGGKDEYSNGNGSLMRVLPLALWHQGSDAELITDAFEQSAVTHAHLRSKLCCALYCLWARNLLNEKQNPFQSAVAKIRELFPENTDERTEFESHIKPEKVHYPEGSGYVIDSLFSTRWALGQGSFEQVVKSAVSLGNDTDTTACIAGGLAGIRDGIDGIPVRWRENLRGREIYEPLLEKLLKDC